jgi:hypothetical protein
MSIRTTGLLSPTPVPERDCDPSPTDDPMPTAKRKEGAMDEQVVDVARSIRPYLLALVGDEAARYDRRLVILLREASAGTDVTGKILAILMESPAMHNWAASMLADERHLPPDLQVARERSSAAANRGYSALPRPYGGDILDARKYVCPVDGNFAWWRISAGQPIPACPDHPSTTLVPAHA